MRRAQAPAAPAVTRRKTSWLNEPCNLSLSLKKLEPPICQDADILPLHLLHMHAAIDQRVYPTQAGTVPQSTHGRGPGSGSNTKVRRVYERARQLSIRQDQHRIAEGKKAIAFADCHRVC